MHEQVPQRLVIGRSWCGATPPLPLQHFRTLRDLRQVDQALRSLDIHPRLVPEAVKLTIASLLKAHADGGEPAPGPYRAAAEIVGYCMIGSEEFAAAYDAQIAPEVEGASSSR